MIADLKPYPAMKASGLPWLGEVPEHWKVRRGKNLFRCIDVRSCAGKEELLTVSSERGVVPRRSATVTMFKAESYLGYKLCWPGDLVINSLWAWARGLGVSRYHGIVSTAYGVYRLRQDSDCDARFINELVRSTSFHWELQVRSKGVWTSRLQLTDDSFLSAPFPKPPISEQSAIVRFLEHADRHIRRYILAKQKLIKLLEEQKQAIIRRAVTRGLDPNVCLKPSGVEWLGDVPEHWEVKLLHHLLDPAIPLAYGILLPGPRLDEGVPYLGAGDVRPDRLRLGALPRTTNEIAAAYPRTRMRPGELVYAIRGSFGNVEVIPPELDGVNLSRDAARLAPRGDIDALWLAFLLKSQFCQEQFKLKEIGATITGVNIRDLKRVVLPVPPEEEQSAIVRFLDHETEANDRIIDRATREISLLREYRTRLIADVVTGKLDVRTAAAKLPEATDEPEPLDDAEALAEGDEETEGADFDALPEEAEA
jgi:type I restriction enzyme S subunit